MLPKLRPMFGDIIEAAEHMSLRIIGVHQTGRSITIGLQRGIIIPIPDQRGIDRIHRHPIVRHIVAGIDS